MKLVCRKATVEATQGATTVDLCGIQHRSIVANLESFMASISEETLLTCVSEALKRVDAADVLWMLVEQGQLGDIAKLFTPTSEESDETIEKDKTARFHIHLDIA